MLRICNLTVAYGNKFTNYKNLTPFPKSKISTAERTLMLLRRIKNLTPFPKSKISTAERTLKCIFDALRRQPDTKLMGTSSHNINYSKYIVNNQ